MADYLYLVSDKAGNAIEILRHPELILCLNQKIDPYLRTIRGWKAIDNNKGHYFNIVGHHDPDAIVTAIASEDEVVKAIKAAETKKYGAGLASSLMCLFEPNFVNHHQDKIQITIAKDTEPGKNFCLLDGGTGANYAVRQIEFTNSVTTQFVNKSIDELKKTHGIR